MASEASNNVGNSGGATGNPHPHQNPTRKSNKKGPYPCKYGTSCNNLNEQHFFDYAHPRSHPRAKIISDQAPSSHTHGTIPVCRFDEAGTCHFLGQPTHMAKFAHPKSASQGTQPHQSQGQKPAHGQPVQPAKEFPALNEAVHIKKSKQDYKHPNQNQQTQQGPPPSASNQRNMQGNPTQHGNTQQHSNQGFSQRGGYVPQGERKGTQDQRPFYPQTQQIPGPFPGTFAGPPFYPTAPYPSAGYNQFSSTGFDMFPQAYPPFYPEPYPGYYPGEEEFDPTEEGDDEFYLDDETSQYYDKFLETLHRPEDQHDAEFQKDFDEFLREQGCVDDGDSEDEVFYYPPNFHQNFAQSVTIADQPNGKDHVTK